MRNKGEHVRADQSARIAENSFWRKGERRTESCRAEARRLHFAAFRFQRFVRLAFADFGGADFAHGGIAGTVAGAPHVPAGDGAVGAPAFPEGQEFFGFGLVFFAVGDGPAFLYAKVVDGENVGAAEAENQKHFDRPGADAADGGEALDEFFIGEFVRVFERGDDAFDGFFGEVFHGDDFCAGEAGFTKGLFAELEHFFWRGSAAGGAESFDARENGRGRFARDGLVGDGFEESFVGALQMVGVHTESFGFGDEEF